LNQNTEKEVTVKINCATTIKLWLERKKREEGTDPGTTREKKKALVSTATHTLQQKNKNTLLRKMTDEDCTQLHAKKGREKRPSRVKLLRLYDTDKKRKETSPSRSSDNGQRQGGGGKKPKPGEKKKNGH